MPSVKFYGIILLMLLSGLMHGCIRSNKNSHQIPVARPKPSKTRIPYGDVGGLPNIGNTCYVNSALQIFARIESLNSVFDYKGSDLNKKHLADLGKQIINNLKDDTKRASENEALVREFYEAFEGLGWAPLGEQHDPEIFLTKIFLQLDYKSLEGYCLPDPEDETNKHTLGNFLFIDSAKLNNQEVPSMQERINAFLKNYNFFLDPSNNILPIRCALQDLYANQKSQHTTHAMQIFIPKAYVSDRTSSDLPYSLVGFIIHIGTSLDGGHYVAYVKTNGRWLRFNDATVDAITDNKAEEASKVAFVYFYQKVQGS
jgi:hypothetical protein